MGLETSFINLSYPYSIMWILGIKDSQQELWVTGVKIKLQLPDIFWNKLIAE